MSISVISQPSTVTIASPGLSSKYLFVIYNNIFCICFFFFFDFYITILTSKNINYVNVITIATLTHICHSVTVQLHKIPFT